MNIKTMFQGMPVNIINDQLDEQRKFLLSLTSRKNLVEADLQAYECEGYAKFKEVVLEREKQRLLLKRMEISAKEVDLHLELQGQFNEVILLSRGKADLEQELKVLRIKIDEVEKKITQMTNALEKQTRRT